MPARWCAPRQEKSKPNGERLPEYTDSRLALLSKTLLDPQPVYPELEQVALEFWLSKLRENLTADAPGTKTFLGKDSPEDAVRPAGAIQARRSRPAQGACGTAAWRRSRPRTIR